MRSEPQQVNWNLLTWSQQDAFDKLSRCLAQAVIDADNEERQSIRDTKSYFESAQSPHAPTFLISGERGTGKTTLILTLMKSTISSGRGQQISMRDAPKEITERIDRYLYRRLVWLEPIELEVLPGPSNLLAAMVARIRDIVIRLSREIHDATAGTGQRPNLLTMPPRFESALRNLQQLATDVALAWDGNLQARAPYLDPDTFAAESIRIEEARLKLAGQFRHALDGLAQNVSWRGEIHKPVFVLPIDDCDLDPTHCWTLMRLLRMLRLPRLFILLAGNEQNIEHVLRLRLAGQISNVAGAGFEPRMIQDAVNDINHETHAIATNALRKLIPPVSHRSRLTNLSLVEALGRSCELTGEDGVPARIRLYDQLQKILIPLTERYPGCTPNLTDVFEARIRELMESGPSEQKLKESVDLTDTYSGSRVFELPIRHWFDLNESLRSAIRNSDTNSNRWDAFSGFVHTLFDESLHEEGTLESNAVSMLGAAFRKDGRAKAGVQLNTVRMPFHFSIESTDEPIRTRSEGRYLPEFRASSESRWQVRLNNERRMPGPAVTLQPRQFATLAALHDIIVAQTNASNSTSPDGAESRLMETIWPLPHDQTISISWKCISLRSIWGWDQFLNLWLPSVRQTDSFVGALDRTSSYGSHERLVLVGDFLAANWLIASAAIVTGHPADALTIAPKAIRDRETALDEFKKVCTQLQTKMEELWQRANRGSRTGSMKLLQHVITEWYVVLLDILTPEMGLSSGVTDSFASTAGSILLDAAHDRFPRDSRMKQRVRRRRANIAARFRRAGADDYVVRLIAPELKSELLRIRVVAAFSRIEEAHQLMAFADRQLQTDKALRQPGSPVEREAQIRNLQKRKSLDSFLPQQLNIAAKQLAEIGGERFVNASRVLWHEARHFERLIAVEPTGNWFNSLDNGEFCPDINEILEAEQSLAQAQERSSGRIRSLEFDSASAEAAE